MTGVCPKCGKNRPTIPYKTSEIYSKCNAEIEKKLQEEQNTQKEV